MSSPEKIKAGKGGTELKQILACRDIPLKNVQTGDVGGYISKESCLSQLGTCWGYREAIVEAVGM